MLDIQLRIFKMVAEKKSFSLAAQELHLTQSSVSQQIQNLEAYYGVKLFDRLHRRIMITQAGSQLYPYAVELERLYQEAREAMLDVRAEVSGRLHIGASMTIGEYLMPRLLVRFSRLYPQVDIAMDIFNTEQITAMVLAGRINLGFVEGPYEVSGILQGTVFDRDALVIVAPPGHRAIGPVPVTLGELMEERWVLREKTSGTRKIYEQFLGGHGYDTATLNVVMELGSTQAVKEAVKAGLGITAISRLAVADEIERGEVGVVALEEGSIDRPFTMLYHREKFCTRAVETFRRFVLE